MSQSGPSKPPRVLFIRDWAPAPTGPRPQQTDPVTTMKVGEESDSGDELQR
ncbi:hypothetical protein [Comamonas sp. JC664]|uniref:hypothetical protein n=1 Tax=Comamonas sp. JC664 TaxID=2801917 RepID=UPI00174C592F|nr:hypothetical protein [Comamonas sp. JC664]MBL0698399.1 hypothetical protein [Comamonas sp. JC664]